MFDAAELVNLLLENVHGLLQRVLPVDAHRVRLELDSLELGVVLYHKCLLLLDAIFGLLQFQLVLLQLLPKHFDSELVDGNLIWLELAERGALQQAVLEFKDDRLGRGGFVPLHKLCIFFRGLNAVDALFHFELGLLRLGTRRVGAPIHLLKQEKHISRYNGDTIS